MGISFQESIEISNCPTLKSFVACASAEIVLELHPPLFFDLLKVYLQLFVLSFHSHEMNLSMLRILLEYVSIILVLSNNDVTFKFQ